MGLSVSLRFTPGYLHSPVERRRVQGSAGLPERKSSLRKVFPDGLPAPLPAAADGVAWPGNLRGTLLSPALRGDVMILSAQYEALELPRGDSGCGGR